MTSKWLALLTLALGACPSVTVDDNEGNPDNGPTVEFDPANKIIPFPNNLLFDPAGSGKLALPEQCNESASSAATRVGILNKLDGFANFKAVINMTFTEAPDPATLDGNVLLFQRTSGASALDPATATPIPVVFVPGTTTRFLDQTDITACADPVTIDQITMVPLVPLEQNSVFTVAVTDGVKTATGADFNPSPTWRLVREPDQVVVADAEGNITTNHTPLNPLVEEDLLQLQGLALLAGAHHDAITFLEAADLTADTLNLGFEFKTQTITDVFDPAVAGTPGAGVDTAALLTAIDEPAVSIAAVAARLGPFAACGAETDTECFLRVLIGNGVYARGAAVCTAAKCVNIGTFLTTTLPAKQYQVETANTLYTGTGAHAIPGQWGDPVKPAVVHDGADAEANVSAIVMLPLTAAPAAGYPTVVFQHGITRSKGDVFAIAGSLTGAGFAVVAIDAALHGSRAIRISNTAALGPTDVADCADVAVGFPTPRGDLGPDPTSHTVCYAPAFSTDLGATRDTFRQGLADQQQLVASLTACGINGCMKLKVDPARIGYIGHSLGGIYGSMTTGVTDGIKAAVLNVAGAGWVDILVNTGTKAFQCPLVDGLIDAGLLVGDKSSAGATALCLTDAWKTMPGFLQFAVIGRWILDPTDPANFGATLAGSGKNFLLQKVDNDQVVPNIATDQLGALTGQTEADASCGIPGGGGAIAPSSELLAAPTETHFLQYLTVAPGSASCAPGNTFTHGSLLAPTGRCQTTTTTICSPGAAPVPPAPSNGCPAGENCLSANDGSLATGRLQTDAIFFLLSNL